MALIVAGVALARKMCGFQLGNTLYQSRNDPTILPVAGVGLLKLALQGLYSVSHLGYKLLVVWAARLVSILVIDLVRLVSSDQQYIDAPIFPY